MSRLLFSIYRDLAFFHQVSPATLICIGKARAFHIAFEATELRFPSVSNMHVEHLGFVAQMNISDGSGQRGHQNLLVQIFLLHRESRRQRILSSP
ncbi:hypothetical protein [Rhodopirellula bahusiensis]|uniref:Uncharacterized protein n=1 Tax=Rhodopirellula bahusiensis TaxID=2014065 RepID=A0A2G1VYL5_9BACT|nr:hypothetical protein [Rhodopirellula bahusiensis]PHQ31886.1 hypothetical protein CEE69_28895 [Rhodopirellula bahusiensis]